MKCEQAQREMTVLATSDLSSILRRARVIRHYKRCPDCTAFVARARLLDAQIARWKSDTAMELPEGFQTRVADAVGDALRDRAAATMLTAASPADRKRQIMPPVTTGTLALAIAGGAAAFFLLLQNHLVRQVDAPPPALIAVAQTAPSALHVPPPGAARIQNVHLTTWTLNTNGDLRPEEETWYENGRWRKEGKYGSRLIVGGKGYPRYDEHLKKTIYGTYYCYDTSKRQVVHMPELGEQQTDFTLNNILPWDARQKMTVVGEATIDGHDVIGYELNTDDTMRGRIWVDRSTGLPVRYTQARRQDVGSASWVVIYSEEYEFNKPLNEALFDANTLSAASLKD